MELLRVVLHGPAAQRRALEHFYSVTLGPTERSGAFCVGHTELSFEPHPGSPFHHFAILLPGNRFAAARAWAAERVPLLGEPWHFDSWDADAVYCHDPAGNIVELIAHRGRADTDCDGEFRPAEFVGLSEVGLVGDVAALTEDLATLDLRPFSAGEGLTFLGEPTSTLILCAEGRGWLPQGRPAEAHPVCVTLSGTPKGRVVTGAHTVRRGGR
jgi:hypothetical protein